MDPALSVMDAQYKSVLETVKVLKQEERAVAIYAGLLAYGNLVKFLPVVAQELEASHHQIEKGMILLNEIANEILNDRAYRSAVSRNN